MKVSYIKVKVIEKIKRVFLYIRLLRVPNTFPTSVHIKTPEETIKKMIWFIQEKQKGAYLRFGDGEINIIDGIGAIEQKSDTSLKVEMIQSLNLSGEGVMKSLMIHSKRFGFSEGMKLGTHLTDDGWAVNLLRRCYQYFIGHNIYSHAALAYSAQFEREHLDKLLDEIKKVPFRIFIGNKNIPDNVVYKHLGENTFRVFIEPTNTYASVDVIESDVKSLLEKNKDIYGVIILSAGPTANVIQKRLHPVYNIFSLDFGSMMDALSGNKTRAWIDDSFTNK